MPTTAERAIPGSASVFRTARHVPYLQDRTTQHASASTVKRSPSKNGIPVANASIKHEDSGRLGANVPGNAKLSDASWSVSLFDFVSRS